MTQHYANLIFSPLFKESFARKDFTPADRRAILKALKLLDENPRHRSLRVHKLQGDRAGEWSASASSSLRISFDRPGRGEIVLLACTKHYDR